MATTTPDAIIVKMQSTVEALTPTSSERDKFKRHDQEVDFRAWCDQNPTAAFRKFSILDLWEFDEPRISDLVNEEVWTTFEFVAAYPIQSAGKYGSRKAHSMQKVMSDDLHQVRHAIGANGYATLDTATGGAATVVEDGPSVEDGQACRFVVLRLRTRYLRAM